MSKLQTPENVPAIEHEREAVLVSSPDGKVLSSALIQAIASVPAVDLRGLEPIVTRKELWSYYCISVCSLATLPYPCEGTELELSSVLRWQQWHGVGPVASCSLISGFVIVGGLITNHPYQQTYSLTLFKSLAFAAGYDPVAGPGSYCSVKGSSG